MALEAPGLYHCRKAVCAHHPYGVVALVVRAADMAVVGGHLISRFGCVAIFQMLYGSVQPFFENFTDI